MKTSTSKFSAVLEERSHVIYTYNSSSILVCQHYCCCQLQRRNRSTSASTLSSDVVHGGGIEGHASLPGQGALPLLQQNSTSASSYATELDVVPYYTNAAPFWLTHAGTNWKSLAGAFSADLHAITCTGVSPSSLKQWFSSSADYSRKTRNTVHNNSRCSTSGWQLPKDFWLGV